MNQASKRQMLLNFSPALVVVIVPALLVWLGGYDIGWSFPQPFNWLSVLLGILLYLGGFGLLIWTIRLFWEKGKGTLTPMMPTQRLVVSGPYRHVRNPMYTGVIMALLGEGILLGSTAILVFAIPFVLLPLFYVPLVEERGLEKRFGEAYRTYKAHVPRWIPRLTPWEGET
jgi:protein-S-isoprenylcysteine O-methyltransferase Ste14